MKIIFFVLVAVMNLSAFSQDNPTTLAKPIVDEGIRLYKSEMASWYGTDLFIEVHKDVSDVGGYFSYIDNNIAKCIFFSKADNPKVIGTISFDSTYNTATANKDTVVRDFTVLEKDLYLMRKVAYNAIQSDTMFKSYQNTNFNIIPLIGNNEKKVYVLTGTSQQGVVMFGNDYLLTFDNSNNLIKKKRLHVSLIPIKYGDREEDGKQIEGTMHTHLPETGEYITATDICTLMLYEKFTKWKQHNVVSKNYLNLWNCQTHQLTVLPMSVVDKINKDQEKKNKKN
jgi:hypothetical protein